jgi:hypothetical protein
MDTLLRLCQLSTGFVEWPLSSFPDHPTLDTIHPNLRSAVIAGHKPIPAFCPTLCISQVQDANNFTIKCFNGYDDKARRPLSVELTFTSEQVKLLLDYMDANSIESC